MQVFFKIQLTFKNHIFLITDNISRIVETAGFFCF